jgi:hypothetical protein
MKLLFAALLSISVFIVACSKEEEKDDVDAMSQTIFEDITSGKNYTFYKGDPSVVPSSPQSAHNAFFRVRFNSIASAALTDNGKLPTNGTFPEGSIIVKDLYDSQTGNIVLYSVLKKESANANSAKGWLWIEYDPAGKEIYKITNKGNGCVNCHSTNHRDYVRLFDLF